MRIKLSLPIICFVWIVASNNTLAASFDCSKASNDTERSICNSSELSSLDNLLAIAWRKAKSKVSLQDQEKWIADRDLCTDEDCLRKEIGVRIGTLLAISDGLEERIEKTPFRYIKPRDVFVRCRKNYTEYNLLNYAEILFSFEKGGPTFKETNIYLDGRFSESVWDWLIWSAVASEKKIVQDKGKQSMLRRNFNVNRAYLDGLKFGRTWAWIIHEDPIKGASFTSFRFKTDKVEECLSFIN